LSSVWQILKAIPQIIGAVKALIIFWLELKKNLSENENEKIRRGIENAVTEKERQAAIDRAAGKFGG
jgi:hypothetical protein